MAAAQAAHCDNAAAALDLAASRVPPLTREPFGFLVLADAMLSARPA